MITLGGVTVTGGTVGVIVGVIVEGVFVGVGVGVGVTVGGRGVDGIAAAGASGGLLAISLVELPSETTVYIFQV